MKLTLAQWTIDIIRRRKFNRGIVGGVATSDTWGAANSWVAWIPTGSATTRGCSPHPGPICNFWIEVIPQPDQIGIDTGGTAETKVGFVNEGGNGIVQDFFFKTGITWVITIMCCDTRLGCMFGFGMEGIG